MDNKNVFVAIALSMSVLLFWGAFFETPRQNQDTTQQIKKGVTQNSSEDITPDINENFLNKAITRKDALAQVNRVNIDNENITGSISLKGAIFDDLSFKKYQKKLGSEEKVIFLNPKDTIDGYFIETGWTSIGNKIKVPTIDTEWKVKGNRILTDKQPIMMSGNNRPLGSKKI